MARIALLVAIILTAVGLAGDIDGYAGNLMAEAAGLAAGVFVALAVLEWYEKRRWSRARTLVSASLNGALLGVVPALPSAQAPTTVANAVEKHRQQYRASLAAARSDIATSGDARSIEGVFDHPERLRGVITLLRQSSLPLLLAAKAPLSLLELAISLDQSWQSWMDEVTYWRKVLAPTGELSALADAATDDAITELTADAQERKAHGQGAALTALEERGLATLDAVATLSEALSPR